MDPELTATDAELREVRAALTRRRKMKKHLKEIRDELTFHRRQLKSLASTMRKEQRDVNKLESASVRALFQTILGNLTQQLEIERQEYLIAALKYNECLDMVHVLDYEVGLLEKKLKDTPSQEEKCTLLFRKKSELLKQSGKDTGKQLKALDVARHGLDIRRVEVDEALIAGKAAALKLRTLHNQLKSVKGWGNYEMQGRGRYSSYAKKSYIDKARKTALQIKIALGKFETEIQDVFRQHSIDDRFDIGRFEKFLQTFYDNLITDWIVQKDISHVLTNVRSVSDKVQRLLSMLKTEHQQIQKEIATINRRRKKLILSC